MVLQFTSQYDPKAIIYMGENMEENFNIREYTWPNDVYFHVKGLSSADVYLRSSKIKSIDEIQEDLLQECLQLTKFSSIKGCK